MARPVSNPEEMRNSAAAAADAAFVSGDMAVARPGSGQGRGTAAAIFVFARSEGNVWGGGGRPFYPVAVPIPLTR
jgi:hypothetical protein